jgi:thioesterase domain-containing protein
LFWCLQGFGELKQLAKYLGNDQPTYGMRSGHLVMKYTPENIEALAFHYAEEIVATEPVGPYLVGGNCQAAIIAFETAQQLQSRGKAVTLLCTLERFVPRLYQGKRALFFGYDSEFQPYKSFQTPELGWRKYCPEGFTLDLVPGTHGHFFEEPNIQVLVEILKDRIEQARLREANGLSLDAAIRLPSNEAYRAVLSAQRNLTVGAGKKVRIPVKVSNVSAEIWPCTDKSGITLGNHWLNESGEVLQWLDGRATLDRDLVPGAAIEFTLPVTAPKTPGHYLLEFDLVEEGIAWFGKKGSKTTLVTVKVSGATGTVGHSTCP